MKKLGSTERRGPDDHELLWWYLVDKFGWGPGVNVASKRTSSRVRRDAQQHVSTSYLSPLPRVDARKGPATASELLPPLRLDLSPVVTAETVTNETVSFAKRSSSAAAFVETRRLVGPVARTPSTQKESFVLSPYAHCYKSVQGTADAVVPKGSMGID